MDAPALLTIAISSRALFDLEAENKIFRERGADAYTEEQLRLLDAGVIPATGTAYAMVKKLLSFNTDERLVDVIVISRNAPTAGLRIFRAIAENKLKIERGCFTRGNPTLPYLAAFGADLFVSAHADDVRDALDNGFAAAHVMGGDNQKEDGGAALRIAFDGDAVLFGDEAERVYQEKGLQEFQEQERSMAEKPLSPGPLKPFLEGLCALKRRAAAGTIRIALITARGAPAHERPIRTLMKWGLEVDEAFYMGGETKARVLAAFRPDFFFDDQIKYLHDNIPSGHVDHGVVNERRKQ